MKRDDAFLMGDAIGLTPVQYFGLWTNPRSKTLFLRHFQPFLR